LIKLVTVCDELDFSRNHAEGDVTGDAHENSPAGG